MDIKSLYDLSEKPLPDDLKPNKEGKLGTCPHENAGSGDSVCESNLLNVNDKNELSPTSPIVPRVLTNPVNSDRTRDGGGEIYPCAENREKGIGLLRNAANEMNHPLNDLMDWFVDDLDDFGCLPVEQVKWIVRDYIVNRERYSS